MNKNMNYNRPAFTFPETLVVGALFALFVLAGTLALSIERARTRDAVRIADMTRVAAAFAILHAQQASYASAAEGCSAVGDLVSACTLDTGVVGLGSLKDPSKYTYTVTRVPDRDDFAVSFHLERRYGSLAAGTHSLTKAGIQ